MADDPIGRWSEGADDAPAELRELLGNARADVPSAAELARVEAGLGSLLGPPGAALPTTPPAGLGALKVAATLAVGAGLIAAGVWLSADEEAVPSKPQPAAESAGAPVPAPVEEAEPPSSTASAKLGPTSVETAPSAEEVAPAPTRAHVPAAKNPTHKKPSESDLLNRAQAALKADPKRALALTRQHKQLYPDGALAQEREVIAIEALSRLDKKGAAEKRADRFGKQYPESAHQEKVRTTVDDD